VATRVLVVEDDVLNRTFLCATLKAGGFNVRGEADGERVLAATQALGPDLITMDINLRHVSGLDVIKALKADRRYRHIPILAITAYVGKGDEELIRRAGAAAYLAKPISIRPLLATVEGLLAASGVTASAPSRPPFPDEGGEWTRLALAGARREP
jgi:two-component system cell cycle response regulator DivK